VSELTHEVPVIYFLLDRAAMLLKIGYSAQVSTRVSGLRCSTGHELVLVGTMRGRRADERVLHQAMASAHVRGEWYRVDQEILSHITEACDEDERAVLLGQLEGTVSALSRLA